MSHEHFPVLPPLPGSVKAGRLPGWNLEKLQARSCPVCGQDSARLICTRPDRLSVVRCRHCEMIYVLETPCAEEIARFYGRYAEFKGYARRRYSGLRLRLHSRHNPYIKILEQSGGLSHSSLIEVGGSFGHFLQMARQCGAQVAGVELDGQARSYLQSLGIPARENLLGNEQADVICAFQLLEHLENPGQLLGQVSQTLVEDGRLLLAVPNAGEYDQAGPYWLGFRVDLEHLNYFSLKTLSRLLAAHNLLIEQYWLHAQPGVGRVAASPPKKTVVKSLWELARLTLGGGLLGSRFESGSFVLTVLARKTSAAPTHSSCQTHLNEAVSLPVPT